MRRQRQRRIEAGDRFFLAIQLLQQGSAVVVRLHDPRRGGPPRGDDHLVVGGLRVGHTVELLQRLGAAQHGLCQGRAEGERPVVAGQRLRGATQGEQCIAAIAQGYRQIRLHRQRRVDAGEGLGRASQTQQRGALVVGRLGIRTAQRDQPGIARHRGIEMAEAHLHRSLLAPQRRESRGYQQRGGEHLAGFGQSLALHQQQTQPEPRVRTAGVALQQAAVDRLRFGDAAGLLQRGGLGQRVAHGWRGCAHGGVVGLGVSC